MLDIKEYFKGYKLKKDALEKYGFQDNLYKRMAPHFNVEMTINLNTYTLYLLDLDFYDEYVNYANPSMKMEYETLIEDLLNKCFDKTLYLSKQGERLHQYIQEKYNVQVEFLFSDYPTFGIYRNPSSKWFAGIMQTKYKVFQIDKKGDVEVINLKVDNVDEFTKINGIYPAWHMNKKLWISILLDEGVEDKIIEELIDLSYSLTSKKR